MDPSSPLPLFVSDLSRFVVGVTPKPSIFRLALQGFTDRLLNTVTFLSPETSSGVLRPFAFFP